jgi:hypothetical protein
MQAFGTKMANIGATMSTRLTLPIVGIGVSMVKAASDAEETATKFAVVFRDVEQGAAKAFETLRNEYGLSTNASKELLGNTGDLLTGFGFSQQAALELSTEVNKLAVDLASFTNFSGGATGASQALTKALLGERESVKSLGISILEEDVQKQVAINTTNGLTFASERQAKAYATLQIAQSQSKNAIGDYARTQDGLANQTRLLQQRMNDLAVSFGEIMIPAINKLVGSLTFVTEAMRDMDDQTKKIIIGVAGFVAIVGPALFVVGSLTKAVIGLGVAFTGATGPIGAMITAIGLLTGAYIMHQMTVTATESATKAMVNMNKGFAQALTTNATQMADFAKESGRTADEIKLVNDAFKEMVESTKSRALKLASSLDTARQELQGLLTLKETKGFIGSIKEERIAVLTKEVKSLQDALLPLYGFLTKASEGMEAFGTATTKATTGTGGGVVHAIGSIDALEAELEGLQAQATATASGIDRADLAGKIRELEERITVLRSVLKPVVTELKLLNEMGMAGDDGFGGSEWDSTYEGVRIVTSQMALLEAGTAIAQQTALQFTDSFGAGMANIIVQGERLTDVLKNIGKLLLSSAIQTGIKLLLMGTSGFGVAGGTVGLIGSLFKPQVASVPTQVMGAGTMQMSGSFKLQGTDLIMSANRSQRQFR